MINVELIYYVCQKKRMYELQDFLIPVEISSLNDDNPYNDGQLGSHVLSYQQGSGDISQADIIILGLNETRGSGIPGANSQSADAIRKQLYQLNYWHTDVNIFDLGNVSTGSSLNDSYAAVKTVLSEILQKNKRVLLIGGSHDNTLGQYYAYKDLQNIIEATCIDATIDLSNESQVRSENFLSEMLTSEPNYIRHYNHIGFQSYLVNPKMLETMDKLRFDCYRVGRCKERIDEMEPVLRNTQMLSFDISAIKNSDAPANRISPNGFTGEEACMLTRYAGMSGHLSSMGIYGYRPEDDLHQLTAKQIAQMIWYFIDGVNRGKKEAALDSLSDFNEFHCVFAEINTLFLQSRKTQRWWMQLPDQQMIACSHEDYLKACRNEIPERWLRAQERITV